MMSLDLRTAPRYQCPVAYFSRRHLRVGRYQTRRCRSRILHIRADSEKRKGLSNPFASRKDTGKEEEARKALQGLFKDKKDSLAAFDVDAGSGGGGSKGGGRKVTGGGGNGNGGWQVPDWREWGKIVWRRLGRSLRALLAVFGFVVMVVLLQEGDFHEMTVELWNENLLVIISTFTVSSIIASILLAICVILLIPLLPQLFGAILTFVRLVLRLDGRARSLPQQSRVDPLALSGTSNLGLHEISVISKYGNDGS